MTKDEIMETAKLAGWEMDDSLVLEPEIVWYVCQGQLESFAALVAAAEREACAKVAGWLHQQYIDTKDAHERHSPTPFEPSMFGFDQSTVHQSQRIADAIRARSQA
jgi:hypothetical protein